MRDISPAGNRNVLIFQLFILKDGRIRAIPAVAECMVVGEFNNSLYGKASSLFQVEGGHVRDPAFLLCGALVLSLGTLPPVVPHPVAAPRPILFVFQL